MQLQQIRIKVLARQSEFEQELAIPIFHRWIRENRLGDELLIDVADYRHVPRGPGVMLIGDQAHYSLDQKGGQLGLAYGRKRDAIGDVKPRLAEAFRAVLTACDALASEPMVAGKLSFSLGRLEIHVMSRLVAPNTRETYDMLKPELEEFLAHLYGGAEITMTHLDQPRQPFGVRVEIAGEHDAKSLLARLPAE